MYLFVKKTVIYNYLILTGKPLGEILHDLSNQNRITLSDRSFPFNNTVNTDQTTVVFKNNYRIDTIYFPLFLVETGGKYKA